MTSENKKKAITSLIVVIITLIGLVISATYAYYGADTSNSFGTKTMTAGAETTGNVALNGTNATIYLNLTTANMRKDTNDITYWGVTSGDPVTTQNVVTIGSTSVSGGKTYNCSYSGSVTASGTNNMYTAFQGMTGKSAGQIVLKIGNNTYDFNTANLFPISISGTLNGLTSSDVANITAEFYLVNKSDVNQTDLAGTDISINVSITNFSCTAITPPITVFDKIIELASDNTCGVQQYMGKVTDRYQDYGVGVDATNVYYLTNNNCNNIIFENYCWKIIRTTETGGVRLLYNGLASNDECNNTGFDSVLSASSMGTSSTNIAYSQGGTRNKPAYVGYMYNSTTGTYAKQLIADDVNLRDSYLKEKTEYWFQNSGINVGMLESTVFCNDRSLASDSPVSEENLSSVSSGYLRFANYKNENYIKTTLECKNQTDAFSVDNPKAGGNGKMLNVGAISAPEAALITREVFNNNAFFWFISPNSFTTAAYVTISYYNASGNGIGIDRVDVLTNVRPVISLNTSVQMTYGKGSTSDPFIVSGSEMTP